MSSRPSTRARALLVTVACAAGLLSVPAAHAAPTHTLTNVPNSGSPEIAVDAAGTGHVVWSQGQDGPDLLVYCRLPRGASACASTQTFPTMPAESFGRPRVVVGTFGVAVLDYRCCGDGSGLGTVWSSVSVDGGTTWSPPVNIGRGEPSGDAVAGPGDFSVSYISSVVTEGTLFATRPLDGSAAAVAPVNFDQNGGAANKSFYGSIGFVTPTQPIVAYGDLTNTFVRIWTGQGSIDDISTWTPEGAIPNLDEPRLTSGPRGVFLLGNPEGDGQIYNYGVRRLGADGQFTPQQPLSAAGEAAQEGDIAQDGGGNVHVVWRSDRDGGRYVRRLSTDGLSFRPREDLGPTAGAAFAPQIGVAPDGGGWIVHDANGAPPIRVTVLPTVAAATAGGGGAAGPGCPAQVTLAGGKVVARAVTGCLKKGKGTTYTTTGAVRVNGVDIGPKGGASTRTARAARRAGLRGVATAGPRARAAASPTITIDTAKRTVKADGNAEARLGSVVLDRGAFTWTVPSGGSGVAATFSDLGAFKAPPVLGLGLTGKAELRFTDKAVEVKVNLELPAPLSSVTGSADLKGTQADGLRLQGLQIRVADVFIGGLRVKGLNLDYKADPAIFEGSGQFLLPPTYSDRDEARIRFRLREGKLEEAVAERIPFNPALPLAPPFASLTAVGFGIETTPALTLLGGAEIAAGPVVLGEAAAKINALPPQGLRVSFGDPVTFRFSGSLEIVSFDVASGFIEYRVPNFLSFGGGANYALPGGVAGANVGIATDPPAFIDTKSGEFSAELVGQVCVPAGCVDRGDNPARGAPSLTVGGKGAISSKGVAACGDLLLVSIGFGYAWGKGADVFGDIGGCDVGAYTVAPSARSRAFRQAGLGTVAVRGGVRQANIAVRGLDGAPAVRVTAPDGAFWDVTPAAPLVQTERAVAFANAANAVTTFHIARPLAGTYRVEQLPGGPLIAEARVAQGLPDVRVSARVGGKARRRTLSYSVRTVPGQRVVFSEVGPGTAARAIGTAKAATGTLRFAPAEGRGGRRKIVALVEQDGIPRERLTVASYTAPPALRPGRPRFARVRRRGSRLVVTWGRSANATGYAVRATLADGRRQLFVVGARTRRLDIPAVSGRFGGRVTVAGLRGSPKAGPARVATVRAVRATRRGRARR